MSITRKRLLVYLIMFLSLVISINLIRDIIRLSHTDERMESIRDELDEAQAEGRRLDLALEEIDAGLWQEKRVRNQLKMARPDEVVVVVPELVTGSGLQSAKSAGEIQTEKANILKWLDIFDLLPAGV